MSRAVIGFMFLGIWKWDSSPLPNDLVDGDKILGREATLLGSDIIESWGLYYWYFLLLLGVIT